MRFFVEKIAWEYGEKYGHVFFPKDLTELQAKIAELDEWGRAEDYPFLIFATFMDRSEMAFTVAHYYSFMLFIVDGDEMPPQHNYIVNPKGNVDEIIPIYYMSSYTEPDTTRMLPLDAVLNAFYYYIEHKKFPPFIQFDDEEINNQFVATHW